MDGNRVWGKFLRLLHGADEKELDVLCQLFLTKNEREMIVERYSLIKTLLSGKLTQREISEKMAMSISLVTAGSKALQLLKEKDRKFLKDHME